MKDKMTVKEFLAKGCLFIDGDVHTRVNDGKHLTVGVDITTTMANISHRCDDRLFVISAKALQKPKRTKVSYEKVSFDKLSEAFAEHEKAPLYGRVGRPNALTSDELYGHLSNNYPIYRKVETEITPMKAAKEACVAFFAQSDLMMVEDFEEFLCNKCDKEEFIKACRAIVNAYDGVE